MVSATPRAAIITASVTTIGCIPALEITAPENVPIAAQSSIGSAKAATVP